MAMLRAYAMEAYLAGTGLRRLLHCNHGDLDVDLFTPDASAHAQTTTSLNNRELTVENGAIKALSRLR